ncbi:MAG: hypothetical protein LBD29_06750 [Treponema sp.]|jgi:thioredoxin-like negative regulator of GroEL|nr:hypothetical protein [Treponema sp.]
MIQKNVVRISLCALILAANSCKTVKETSIAPASPKFSKEESSQNRPSEGDIVYEIRSSAEKGTPSSLQNGLELIRNRNLETNDFGRVMNGVITALIQKLYPNPAGRTQISFSALPQTSLYSKILQKIESGKYIEPAPNSQDYLEYVLPFLALLKETNQDQLMRVLPYLERAEELNPSSVLAPYFIGLVYERMNNPAEAIDAYWRAYKLSSECYPAALGLVHLMNNEGQKQEALWILEDLAAQFPDNRAIKRELAQGYYYNEDWYRAEPAIREVLQQNSREPEFILMQAHVLVEQGQYLKAVAPLDQYASIDTTNNLYLFLRARIQAEGYHNQEAALNYLRSMLRLSEIDDKVAVYAAGLLLDSGRTEEQEEGQKLLQRLLEVPSPPLMVIELALNDGIRREAWSEAKGYLRRLLNEGASSQYLLKAYLIERNLGNKDAAFGYAKELHEKEPSNEEGTITYISALIDIGQFGEARSLIESRLAALNSGAVKAMYYYQRSRIQGSQEAGLNDLRSSLFEDPRNINALLGLLEIYHQQGDGRRALYYYKQARSFEPNNPRLRQYEKIYANE